MTDPTDHHRRLERMYLAAPVNRYFEPAIDIGDGTATVRLTVRPDFFHAAGAAHGAVYFKLLDDATFFAAASQVEDVFILTASFTIDFRRPVSEGPMIATGTVTGTEGRRIFASGTIVDGDGNELASGRGVFVRSRTRLSAELGYE